MTTTDTLERPSVATLVELALGVPGVRGVLVDRDRRGDSLLRLDLEPGADERRVAEAVSIRLRDGAPADRPAPPVPPAAVHAASPAVPASAPVPERSAPSAAPSAPDAAEAPAVLVAPAAPGPVPAAPAPSAPAASAPAPGEPVDGETVPAPDAVEGVAGQDAPAPGRGPGAAPLLGAAAVLGAADRGSDDGSEAAEDELADDREGADRRGEDRRGRDRRADERRAEDRRAEDRRAQDRRGGDRRDPAPRTPRGRSGRVSVPAVSTPQVASTPAPQWLEPGSGSAPVVPLVLDVRDEALAGQLDAGHLEAGRADPVPERTRLELRRVQVATEGFTTVAEVTLAHGSTVHTGVADAAASASGTHRALAGAVARALESAGRGELRIEVDGVQVETVAGEATVVVALSLVTRAGSERLTGSALVASDPHRAVVHAVLAASNRRMAMQVVDV